MAESLDPPWRADADCDDAEAAARWAASGAQWLTAYGVGVPVGLVREASALVGYLDERGGERTPRLGDEFPGRGVGILAARANALGLAPAVGLASCGGATRFVQAADGWVAVSLARPEDREVVPAWLEVTPGAAGEEWDVVTAEVARRRTGDVVERAALVGVPCAAVGETTDRRPVLLDRHGDAPPRRLDDLLVVNLGSLWAAPLAGDLLARLGARVIKVESTSRPDGARATPALYAELNRRSAAVALPLREPAGREQLAALLARADVVIEASRPRALRQLGIQAEQLVSTGPQVWVTITAHGRTEPNAVRVGFGDDAAAAGGLVGWTHDDEPTGDRPDQPRFIADAVADPLAGLAAAATVCHLAERGGRWLADVALARVAASVAGPAVHVEPAPDPAPPPELPGDAPEIPLGRDTATVLASLGITP